MKCSASAAAGVIVQWHATSDYPRLIQSDLAGRLTMAVVLLATPAPMLFTHPEGDGINRPKNRGKHRSKPIGVFQGPASWTRKRKLTNSWLEHRTR